HGLLHDETLRSVGVLSRVCVVFASLVWDSRHARNSRASVKMTSALAAFNSTSRAPYAHAAPTAVTPASRAAFMSATASPTWTAWPGVTHHWSRSRRIASAFTTPRGDPVSNRESHGAPRAPTRRGSSRNSVTSLTPSAAGSRSRWYPGLDEASC